MEAVESASTIFLRPQQFLDPLPHRHRGRDRYGKVGCDPLLTSNLMLALRLVIESKSKLAGSKLTPRPQHFLNFLPLPQGHGSFPPTFCFLSGWRGTVRRGFVGGAGA